MSKKTSVIKTKLFKRLFGILYGLWGGLSLIILLHDGELPVLEWIKMSAEIFIVLWIIAYIISWVILKIKKLIFKNNNESYELKDNKKVIGSTAVSISKTFDIMKDTHIYNFYEVEKEVIKEKLTDVEEEYIDEVIDEIDYDLPKSDNNLSNGNILYKLRNNKEYKEISLERKIELENYVKELYKKTKITSYTMIKSNKEGNIFSSKIGGIPYWDLEEKFPTDADGNNLLMLCQINFDNEKFEGKEFPTEGMLQFFAGTDDSLGLDEVNPDIQKSWRIVYHSKVNYNVTEDDIINLNLPELEYKIGETNTCGGKLLGYPCCWKWDPRENENFKRYNTLLFELETGRRFNHSVLY